VDEPTRIERLVSGGQTGVDRGALDAALDLGIPHGGWCPRGRAAEDGVIPARYQLRETESPQYPVRTEQNVIDSDGTLVLTIGAPSGGTAYTVDMARRHAKPLLVIDLDALDPEAIMSWLRGEEIAVLNVAGPRESKRPGIAARVRACLRELLGTP
jgi:hypothetical protein